MFIARDSNIVSVGTILIRKLYLHIVVITNLVDGGAFLPNNVGMVLGADLECNRKTTKSLKLEKKKIEINKISKHSTLACL